MAPCVPRRNDNRNKVRNKHDVLESPKSHLPSPVCGKLVFQSLVPKLVGTAALKNSSLVPRKLARISITV